jgi:peptide methionine sulfoxide reductase MsrA
MSRATASILLLSGLGVSGLRVGQPIGRRGVLIAAAASTTSLPANAAPDPLVKIYFGAGCFWHVQHEMVGEEKAAGRASQQITAVSGYAGGQRLGDGSKVCYHNAQRIADYGSLGHAEAVQVEIPASSVPRFAQKYFSLFGPRGIRHDPQDAGGEYRSVIGLPGGENSPFFEAIQRAAGESPMRLVAGRGDERDTLSDKTVLIYDSKKFPFYPAELYHQFHDDFMGSPYGKAYNSLNANLYKAGVLKNTGCPEPPPGSFFARLSQ